MGAPPGYRPLSGSLTARPGCAAAAAVGRPTEGDDKLAAAVAGFGETEDSEFIGEGIAGGSLPERLTDLVSQSVRSMFSTANPSKIVDF